MRLRCALEARLAQREFARLGRAWACASLAPGLCLWAVARAGEASVLGFPAFLAWAPATLLGVAFRALAFRASRRARATGVERIVGEHLLVSRRKPWTRTLEGALLAVAAAAGTVLAVSVVGVAVLPAEANLVAGRVWAAAAAGAILCLAFEVYSDFSR